MRAISNGFFGKIFLLLVFPLLLTACPTVKLPPVAAFSASPASGKVPLTVAFTNLSLSGSTPIDLVSWKFGDSGESTAFSPIHTYTSPGAYTVELSITTAIGQHSIIREALINVLPLTGEGEGEGEFPEDLWLLDHDVVDAEYDRNSDTIVTVSNILPRLNICDPMTGSQKHVSLRHPTKCVAVRNDGLYATVGHDGFISLINLPDAKVEEVFEVSCNVFDIVLAPNGWIYSMPHGGHSGRIRCTELATGIETLGSGRSSYASQSLRLHPSGDYIYAANNHVSPSDVEKFDIRNGTAAYVHESPYHGEFEFLGDLWFLESGSRMIARSGDVFHATEAMETDIVFRGRLSDEKPVKWMDHSDAAGFVYVTPRDKPRSDSAPAQVNIYEEEYLVLRATVALPRYETIDEMGVPFESSAGGGYVFSGASGKAFHAVYPAAFGPAVSTEWAVKSYRVSDIPGLGDMGGDEEWVENEATSEDGVWRLKQQVIDAAYDKTNDVLITVTDQRYAIHALDPSTHTGKRLALPLPPRCVAVRPDGLFAAVGHTGYVSIVNLSNMTMDGIYDIRCEVQDLLFSSNNWIYAIPLEPLSSILSRDLDTGEEFDSTGLHQSIGSNMALVPAEDAIYTGLTRFGTERISKFQLQNSIPDYRYYDQFYDDMRECEGVWISPDGLRAFSCSGQVFRLSPLREHDIVYNGRLTGTGMIGGLDFAAKKGLVVTKPETADAEDQDFIEVFSYETLALQQRIPLPGLRALDAGSETEVYATEFGYVFIDSAENNVFALVRGKHDTPVENEWAVVEFELED